MTSKSSEPISLERKAKSQGTFSTGEIPSGEIPSGKIPSGEEFKAKIAARRNIAGQHDFDLVTNCLNSFLMVKFADESDDNDCITCNFASDAFYTSWQNRHVVYTKLEEHYKKMGYSLKLTLNTNGTVSCIMKPL